MPASNIHLRECMYARVTCACANTSACVKMHVCQCVCAHSEVTLYVYILEI